MKIINGHKIANQVLADLKQEIKLRKLKPCLAIILIGSDPASQLYVKLKQEKAKQIGVKAGQYLLADNVSEREVLEIINKLNQNSEVNGILVQMPLPKHLSKDKIVSAISLAKDVDGFVKNSHFQPPFILAIEKALKETREDLKDKKILALVNSDVFGKVLQDKLGIRYLLGFNQDLSQADVVITALGKPNIIKGDMIKQGAILIDGGISQKNGKIVGDIDRESVQEKAKWLSPVPGGVGPLTVAFLFKNVIGSEN
ncbi:MAG: bifunctional methylenetetrahydrofolate dehydrogenase/methenyltetrahydrofolate cyclohydrolase [Parcubacteria group bacterium]|jgi:methylenetetrahydrofolate dehydrogenase (NADP+)/methenyltetrahydrofolate cyclohydrolase|nr:bifunctional methylenetetrahydrofolate dehydrogenase/methenyltetrahydrofolate cyclohydrolase [Parcubacteria group bacterium]|tara:strand:+ start:3232 stop:3999 length:768 start_codon:yes stop_codon:yes gene_type:complete